MLKVKSMEKNRILFLLRKRNGLSQKRRTKKQLIPFNFDKRQKFVVSVLILSAGFFITEFQFSAFGLFICLGLSILSVLFFFWSVRGDIPYKQDRAGYSIFILPFFFTLAFGFFYLLVPARLIARISLSLVYGVGLYSLYLCQNIFIVGSARTIQLLSGARIVSFVLTLISFFFLTNSLLTLHVSVLIVLPILSLYTFLLSFQSLWTYAMQSQIETQFLLLWTTVATFCVVETASLLWFWPSNPTIIALFLTGFFYTIIGASDLCFTRRLFRGVLWEYVWVSVIVFFILILTTQWGK